MFCSWFILRQLQCLWVYSVGGWVICEWLIGKELERTGRGVILIFAWRNWGKLRKASVEIVCVIRFETALDMTVMCGKSRGKKFSGKKGVPLSYFVRSSFRLSQKSRENICKSSCGLISNSHRALLQSVTFISRLMHSIIQNADVKI